MAEEAVKSTAPGGGTTLTALLILGNRMLIAHVGDCRAYQIPPSGDMKLLTRDHSLARRLEELGQLSTEEAESHPQRHDLYRALGMEVPAEPDIFTSKVPPLGNLLLCSDGLWGVVPEPDIARIVRSAPNLPQAVVDLIEAANAAGGPDNISAILVRLPD
jgi:protein phosphatase